MLSPFFSDKLLNLIPDPNLITDHLGSKDQLLGDLSAIDENCCLLKKRKHFRLLFFFLDGYMYMYNEKHYIVYHHCVYTEHVTNGVYIQPKYNTLP